MTGTGRGWVWAANVATLLNGVCGASALFFAVAGNKPFALFLIVGGVGFDGLDGMLFRRSGRAPSLFGRVADSVADAVTFCLAPGAVVAVNAYDAALWSPWEPAALAVGCAVAGIGLVRLVYFTAVAYRRPYFTGSSTPQNAMWVALVVLLFQWPGYLEVSPLVELLLVVAAAPVMVLPVRYPKVRAPTPLRPLTLLLTVFLALAVVLTNFAPTPGTPLEHLAAAAAVTGFALLLLFYLAGPLYADAPERPVRERGAPPHADTTET